MCCSLETGNNFLFLHFNDFCALNSIHLCPTCFFLKFALHIAQDETEPMPYIENPRLNLHHNFRTDYLAFTGRSSRSLCSTFRFAWTTPVYFISWHDIELVYTLWTMGKLGGISQYANDALNFDKSIADAEQVILPVLNFHYHYYQSSGISLLHSPFAIELLLLHLVDERHGWK